MVEVVCSAGTGICCHYAIIYALPHNSTQIPNNLAHYTHSRALTHGNRQLYSSSGNRTHPPELPQQLSFREP